jgi:hypothetical protein
VLWSLQRELQKVEATLQKTKKAHHANTAAREAARETQTAAMTEALAEAEAAGNDCGAAKDERATVATWQSFLDWVHEVRSQQRTGGASGKAGRGLRGAQRLHMP